MAEKKILLCVYGAPFSLSIPVIGHLGCDQCCRKCKYLCSMLTWSPLANSKESYGHALCRSVFSTLRNYHTIFHHGWTSWHSQQQCLSFLPPSPAAPSPVFLIFISLMTSIVDGVTWNLNIILIHILWCLMKWNNFSKLIGWLIIHLRISCSCHLTGLLEFFYLGF